MIAGELSAIGDGAVPSKAAAESYCYLRTIGRVSGRPHEVEMWFAADGQTLYLLAGGRNRADWVRNIQQKPTVQVRIGAVTYTGTGRMVEGTADEERARRLVAAKYYGWQGGPLPNAWAREALPIAIDLEAVASEPDPANRSDT